METPNTVEGLLREMPVKCKYLGTINDAHFVLRKLVGRDKNKWRAYYEDEDTDLPVEGYEFRDDTLFNVLNKLYIEIHKEH